NCFAFGHQEVEPILTRSLAIGLRVKYLGIVTCLAVITPNSDAVFGAAVFRHPKDVTTRYCVTDLHGYGFAYARALRHLYYLPVLGFRNLIIVWPFPCEASLRIGQTQFNIRKTVTPGRI